MPGHFTWVSHPRTALETGLGGGLLFLFFVILKIKMEKCVYTTKRDNSANSEMERKNPYRRDSIRDWHSPVGSASLKAKPPVRRQGDLWVLGKSI